MALKKPAPPEGAPSWIVTYGDMMSLLLCFFVLLAALANYDKNDKRMMAMIESIRESLGSPGQSGWLSEDQLDFKTMLVDLTAITAPNRTQERGFSEQEGATGQQDRVRDIRDGLEIVVGAPVPFERFRADLTPDAQAVLEQIAAQIRGLANKIEVRGHATNEPLPADSPYGDAVALSFARAQAVYSRLVELGIDERRIRVVAVGAHEPLVRSAYSEEQRAKNRRAEVVVLEALITEYEDAAEDGG